MTSAQKVSGRLLLPWLPARWGSDLKALKEIVARVIHGEEQYFASPDDALELSRVLDAARMSSRLGQAVYLR